MNAPWLRRAQVLTPRRPERPQLGWLLRNRGVLGETALEAALTAQRQSAERLGQVLVAHGWSDEATVAAALAEQRGLGFVDLGQTPPDPALIDPRDASVYIESRILPWRKIGRVTTYVVADPQKAAHALARLSRKPDLFCIAVACKSTIERHIGRLLKSQLAERAAFRTPSEYSVRDIGRLRRGAVLGLFALSAVLWFGGTAGAMLGLLALFLLNAATTLVRLSAVIAGRARPDGRIPAPENSIDLALRRPFPKITVLVPLFREAEMVGEILHALSALDYPREALEILLLVEEKDHITRRALAAEWLPNWVRVIVVPDGKPRTKPRAMNYALDFCNGEIIGILDAEDRPAADQLRAVAETMMTAPPDVACLQCQLSYYNARENWITRCFQIEYSIWFEVLLRGFQALRLPIPLGGTSVYFRRSALEMLGGWDAHNVTEDADLGMRLARLGYRCQVLRSVTLEEANCRPGAWIRQRSRWLKGYLLTWLSHMRAPGKLWRELGPRGFFGLNVLFLGAAATYLAMPLFWMALIGWIVTGESYWQSAVPGWVVWPAGISLALGQVVMLGCAALAMKRRGAFDLLLWVPTLPVYWTLGALAAWKAVVELVVAPFYWDKTRHGISRFLQTSNRRGQARALQRRV